MSPYAQDVATDRTAAPSDDERWKRLFSRPAFWLTAVAALTVVSGTLGVYLSGRPTIVSVTNGTTSMQAAGGDRRIVVTSVATSKIPLAGVDGFSYVIDHNPGTVPKPVINATTIPDSSALAIPTYDGSGQANHPGVIDFLTEFGMRSWAGYRYWMSMTPYPQDNDGYENPSILVSNDGVRWTRPKGLRAPLATPSGGFVHLKNHLSDPDLVYDAKANRLVLFYRENEGSQADSREVINRLDISFSGASFHLQHYPAVVSRFTRDVEILSPGVVIDRQGMWHMWFTSFYPEGGAYRKAGILKLFTCSSSDGVRWGDPVLCTPSLDARFYGTNPRPNLPFGGGDHLYPWHLEAKLDGDKIQLLICTSTRASDASLDEGSALYLVVTTPSHPASLTFPVDGPLVAGNPDEAIYRAGFVPGPTDRIWYSARDDSHWFSAADPGHWKIAFLEGRVSDGIWSAASSAAIELPILTPGHWYFHVRAVSGLGAWSGTSTKKVDVLSAR